MAVLQRVADTFPPSTYDRAVRQQTSCQYFSLPPYDKSVSLLSNSTRKPALH